MTIAIKQPSAADDRMPIASVAIVAAACLPIGLYLAHAAMGHPAPQIAEAERERERESAAESATTTATASTGPVAPTGATSDAPPPSVPAPVAFTRVTHGRLAYLRCDGAPQLAGPFPCPRDPALEDTVWGAIDQAASCVPPLPPGQADLVIELYPSGGTPTTIATRDTFPDDAIRTDAASIVACMTPLLANLTTTLTGDRIRVGFRFTLE